MSLEDANSLSAETAKIYSGHKPQTPSSVQELIYDSLMVKAAAGGDAESEVLKNLDIDPMLGAEGSDPRKVLGISLIGAPGVAKTHSVQAACERFAEDAGLIFVKNPPPDFVIDPERHFVFNVMHLAGANSPMQIGVIPRATRVPDASNPQNSVRPGYDLLPDGRSMSFQDHPDSGAIMNRLEAILLVSNNDGLQVAQTEKKQKGPRVEFSVELQGPEQDVSEAIDKMKLVVQKTISERNPDLRLIDGRVDDARETGPADYKMDCVLNKAASGQDEEVRVRVNFDLCNPSYFSGMRIDESPLGGDVNASVILPSVQLRQNAIAQYGALVFDDIGTVATSVRNMLLELMQNGRANGFSLAPRTLICTTANLGAADGTEKSQLSRASLAELSRTRIVLVVPEADEFCKVLEQTAKAHGHKALESLGDDELTLHWSSFIRRYPEILEPTLGKDAKQQVQQQSPTTNCRSIANTMTDTLRYVCVRLPRGSTEFDMNLARESIEKLCHGTIAHNCFDKYLAHFDGMRRNAVPCAQQFMSKLSEIQVEQMDKPLKARIPLESFEAPKIYSNYANNEYGFHSAEARDFSFQFTDAMMDAMSSRLYRITKPFMNAVESGTEGKTLENTAVQVCNEMDAWLRRFGMAIGFMGSKACAAQLPQDQIETIIRKIHDNTRKVEEKGLRPAAGKLEENGLKSNLLSSYSMSSFLAGVMDAYQTPGWFDGNMENLAGKNGEAAFPMRVFACFANSTESDISYASLNMDKNDTAEPASRKKNSKCGKPSPDGELFK